MTFALQFIGFNGDLIGFYGDSDDQTEQKGDVKRTSTLGRFQGLLRKINLFSR